jgi:hypothetical protein
MQHPEEGTIHAWLDGALSPSEAAAIDAHVRSCAACAAAVAEARGMIAGAARIVSALDIARGVVVPSAPASRAPRPASGSSLWRRLHLTPSRAALAATILVAVAGTLVVRHQRPLVDAIDQGRPIDSPIVRIAPVVPIVAQPAVHRDSTSAAPPPERRTSIKRSTAMPSSPKASASNGPLTTPLPAPAPAPAAATSATAANVDTMARPVAKSAERADFAAMASGARAAARVQRLEAATMTDVPGIVGCYQLSPQSADSAFGLLPDRFALERGGANSPRNIVRSVSSDGRIDSVVAGTTWRQAAPNQLSIVFANNGVVNRTVELELTEARAQAFTPSKTNLTLPVRRVDCVR